jgi:putative hydrolase of the HAD superfamily
MIQAIIFDWGGVLIDDPADGLIAYCARSLHTDSTALKSVFSFYEERFQKGQISEQELWKQICNQLAVSEPSSSSLWKEAVKAVFTDKKKMIQLVQTLKNKGYRTAFLSNTEDPAVDYFFEQKYDRYFDVTLFSCKEKSRKPEEMIYLRILERLHLHPEECVFIDDKNENITMAKKIGNKGILFHTPSQVIAELEKYGIQTHPSSICARDIQQNRIQ